MKANNRPESYPEVATQADYPALENEILDFWAKDKTFSASLEIRDGASDFVFYDGPPFANGLPHYGHLLTGFVKDAIPRYKTMRGWRVERRFGWDCHGLPAEVEAEHQLGVSGRRAITEYGIDRFNDYCKTSVMRYTQAWQSYVTRQGRWVDFDNDYKTMDLSFMESVLFAFKSLYERDLIYEGFRALPYCWECETPLSNSETRQDDAYRDRVDPALTVLFQLDADEHATGVLAKPLRLAAWTTTPWTLPSNLGLAVGPELNYDVLEYDGSLIVIGSDRVSAYAEELGEATHVATIRGVDLIGRHYAPLFSYFADEPNAFVVIAGDFVSTEEGTGIVHLAPGFGEDDQRVCEAAGIAVVCPVNDQGRFDERVREFVGEQVFEANPKIVDLLTEQNVVLRHEDYTHSYPHCWRSDTPLIYRAVSSYFVRVTAMKNRLLETNQEINWVPERVRDGAFGKWLEGARDWSITRNRYWGAPIPVWKSDDPSFPRIDVYGSLDELEADFGLRPADLHRPGIDNLTRPNPDDPSGNSTMRRVTDVLDCWFESASMPFAQLHYPFENATHFDENFPADFICEYVGQTRGWFYNLHVIAGALFDRPAFKNCVAHGIVQGNDGRKLSKRLKNYPDPEEFFAKYGADTMRWYLLSSPVLAGRDVAIEDQAMADPIRQVLNMIWNCWHFLSLYGRIDNYVGEFRTDATGVLDRYVLAKTAQLRDVVTDGLDAYDFVGACNAVTSYLDALSNWYVRRSRERFWRPFGTSEQQDADKRDAYDTLHTVLVTLCEICAPLLPFLTEEIYRGMTGARSVHLVDWPEAVLLPSDDTLVSSMDLVREVCSAGHSIRKAEGRGTRVPLSTMTYAGPRASLLEGFTDLIADELNVKSVVLKSDVTALATTGLSVVPAALGPRLGAVTQKVIKGAREKKWEQANGVVSVDGIELEEGEYTLALRPTDAASGRVLPDGTGLVALDLEVTEELAREGTARDLVRLVQQARKDSGLQVTDRIELEIVAPPPIVEIGETWRDEIATKTLALKLTFEPGSDDAPGWHEYALGDGRAVHVRVTRV